MLGRWNPDDDSSNGCDDNVREPRHDTGAPYFEAISMTCFVDALNYYRLEAGRFEDFVSYGLKSFAHEGVTLKLSSPSLGSVPSWPRIYSAIASSVTLPLDATK